MLKSYKTIPFNVSIIRHSKVQLHNLEQKSINLWHMVVKKGKIRKMTSLTPIRVKKRLTV
jgi:hypothetical protein